MLQSNSDKFAFLTQSSYLSCLPDNYSTILDYTFINKDKQSRTNNNKRRLGAVMKIIKDHYNSYTTTRQVGIRNYPDKQIMLIIKRNIKKYGIILQDIHKDRIYNTLNVTIKYTDTKKFYEFTRDYRQLINQMREKIDD
jgi:hypothetical protein